MSQTQNQMSYPKPKTFLIVLVNAESFFCRSGICLGVWVMLGRTHEQYISISID